MQMQGLKTAIYCRVACADQMALDMQIECLREYAAEHGIDDITVYSDNGYSGLDYNRPGFSLMECDIEDGAIEAVIVRDLSRIGRNMVETIQWITGIRDRGIVFIQADLPFGDNFVYNRNCLREAVMSRLKKI